ncbi:beta-galactosidase [Arthrobacter silviterrae]|uniref:Beta-galactosidase n=1 Tax=Arthrobacter silviterrae TaxID=2026658 RepID=A0ABX0DD69_9MICC|nr:MULTISPECIES: beta-galactosidase [Arthrobacter]MCU6481351.1 beta-galactosidase [Arthrobacter sp. A2-55]MDQ0276640.1 beta-galactosidase [Arthrobacter silviterrae]NGN84578.1 beta-galactosidase [Arthrobacter silviterrae]
MTRTLELDGIAFGGDYNPEQWPREVWEEDIRLMRQAGVNFITVSVFSWPLLEPVEGCFDFGWLDDVIELLHGAGIAVDLATATATPPAWLIRKYPQILPVTADGTHLEFGSRQAYCFSSPIFRRYALRLTRAMAERYGKHPAVRLWHVSNEYGDHVPRCWCDASAVHFRTWLRTKYRSIDALNEAWGTSCWGQHYLDFESIEPPRESTGPINSTQHLDFERFSSAAMLELFTSEVEVLREVTPELPVTTNFMSILRELDYFAFADAEDIVTDDAYPDPADPGAHIDASLNYALMRGAKGGAPWLLLEQSASAVSWRDVNVPKAPGVMRLDSYQALAHGADGIMYFQWRAAKFGPEKFHAAILGHRGEASRTFQECSLLGAELRQLGALKGSRVEAHVAMLCDWDNMWALAAPDSLPTNRLSWIGQARDWHRASFTLGATVDLVRAGADWSAYRVLLVPNIYLATPGLAAQLDDYAAAGGTVVVGAFSGVVDENDHVHPGGAPGPLRGLLGVEVDEVWPLPDGESGQLRLDGALHAVHTVSEWLDAPGARTVASYSGGELDGRPAVTVRDHGRGAAWYVSACLADAGLRELVRRIFVEAGVPLRDGAGPDVEVVVRRSGDTSFTFVLNRSTAALDVSVPARASILVGGDGPAPGAGGLQPLPARGVLVVRHDRADTVRVVSESDRLQAV